MKVLLDAFDELGEERLRLRTGVNKLQWDTKGFGRGWYSSN